MNRYVITSRSVALHSGVLELTKAQAADRLHNLETLGGGRYRVIRTVEFKAGEEIGYEGDLPKVLADLMVDPEQAAAAEADQAKGKKGKKSAQPPAAETNEAAAQ